MDELTLVRNFRDDRRIDEEAQGAARAVLLTLIDSQAPPTVIGPRPRSRIRRALAPATVLVLAAGALAAALSLHGGHVSLTDRALAAVSGGPVLHVVLTTDTASTWAGPGGSHPRFEVVDLASGHTRASQTRTEYWFDRGRGMLHSVSRVEGAVLWDSLQTRTASLSNFSRPRLGEGQPAFDPALGAFFLGYEKALKSGKARDAGTTTVRGRDVRWLRFPTANPDVTQLIGLDARSFDPLYLRSDCRVCTTTPPMFRIARLEGISRAASNFQRPIPPSKARVVGRYMNTEQRPVAAAAAARLLVAPILWVGRSFANTRLTLIQLVNNSRHRSLPITKANAVSRAFGVNVIYGATLNGKGGFNAGDPRRVFGITETTDWRTGPGNWRRRLKQRQPTVASGAPLPPEGQAALSSFGGHWDMQLKRGKLYVEIFAPTRSLALAIAKRLHVAR